MPIQTGIRTVVNLDIHGIAYRDELPIIECLQCVMDAINAIYDEIRTGQYDLTLDEQKFIDIAGNADAIARNRTYTRKQQLKELRKCGSQLAKIMQAYNKASLIRKISPIKIHALLRTCKYGGK